MPRPDDYPLYAIEEDGDDIRLVINPGPNEDVTRPVIRDRDKVPLCVLDDYDAAVERRESDAAAADEMRETVEAAWNDRQGGRWLG